MSTAVKSLHESDRSNVAPLSVWHPTHLRSVQAVLAAAEEGLRLKPCPELAPLVNGGASTSLPIQRWYRYREAFSPNLVSHLQLGHRVLDPFCGCGSIMVGAAQTGRKSVGVEINPLGVFVAQVKLRVLTPDQLASVAQFAKEFRGVAAKSEPMLHPGLKISDKVFEPQIRKTLLCLKSAIEAWADLDYEIRDFLFLAWLVLQQQL